MMISRASVMPANSLARHGRSKRPPAQAVDRDDHARREGRWASRRHEHPRMLVGPKCGAHIPCDPSFDGPDCASAHDRRIAVTRLSGGQPSRAGLAHSCIWQLLAVPLQPGHSSWLPPAARTARPRIPGPRVNGTQLRNLAVLRL